MADRKAPGERLSRRLAARNAEGIQRTTAPDGGEVYSGPLASRALRAIGARAMTMDNTMFVAEDFDASNPEDQALYAHEQVHMEGSGGADSHGDHDAEEVAARAIERMVLHRASKGEGYDTIMRDIQSMGVSRTAAAESSPGGGAAESVGSDAELAYQSLLDQGKSHEQIVIDLSRFVLSSVTAQQDATMLRRTEVETF